jgi:hypothetical protein
MIQFVIRPEMRDYLIAHQDDPIDAQAAALGLARSTIKTYRFTLRREGLITTRLPKSRRDTAFVDELCDRLGLGEHPRLLARRVGLSYRALVVRVTDNGHKIRGLRADGGVMTLRDVGMLFGYSHGGSYRAVMGWVDAGLLAALPRQDRGGRAKRGSPWRFTVDALIAFLNNPATWDMWSVERITDPDWREYAVRARNHPAAVALWRGRRRTIPA